MATQLDHLLERVNLGDVRIRDGRAVLTDFHQGHPDRVLADVTDLCDRAAHLGLIRHCNLGRARWALTWDGAMELQRRLDKPDPDGAGAALVACAAGDDR